MSSHSGFKQNRCWSCEYFSGEREYKKGIFLGDLVHTGYRGKCTNERSNYRNKDISEDGYCSRYQKWGVIQSALAMKEQKQEAQRIINEIKKEKEKAEESSYISKPLTAEERRELELRQIKYEKELKERKKQEKIANQQAKINSINKSPTTAGIVSTVISIFAFLFAWIPYWYFDARRAAAKSTLDELFKLGHTMEEPIMQEMYLNGLHAKEARNSVIWIPFVIFAIGIVVTIAVINHYKKTKPSKLALAKKELEQIEKETI